MEAEQRVQDRQRPVGDAERLLGFGERAKQSPFMDDRLGCVRFRREILASPPGSPPWRATAAAAQRASLVCVCMILCLVQAKEICSPKRRRLLTAIRGSVILSSCYTSEKGFRDGDVSGAFFFCWRYSFRRTSIIFRLAVSGFERTKLLEQLRQASGQELREGASCGFASVTFTSRSEARISAIDCPAEFLISTICRGRGVGPPPSVWRPQGPRETLVAVGVDEGWENGHSLRALRRRASSRNSSANSCQRPRPILGAFPMA